MVSPHIAAEAPWQDQRGEVLPVDILKQVKDLVEALGRGRRLERLGYRVVPGLPGAAQRDDGCDGVALLLMTRPSVPPVVNAGLPFAISPLPFGI